MSLNSTIRIPQVTGTLAYVDLYEIVQDLEGASSPVYRAKKIGSRFGDVVVRPLPPGLEAAEDLFRQMRGGFQRIGALRHPNIVPLQCLHEVGEVRYASDEARHKLGVGPGDLLVVTEFATGKRLDKWRAGFAERGVPLDQAVEVVRQICQALDYAHRHGVLHLALKPQNVKVDRRTGGGLVARVMDFRPLADEAGLEPGDSGAFMAPEQIAGAKPTAAADLYSAAALFLWLVTGGTSRDLLEKLPPAIRPVVERALDEDPAKRPAACGAFATDLVAATVRTARRAGLLSCFRTMQAVSPRLRRVLALTAVALFALAGGLHGWNLESARRAAARAAEERTAREAAARKAAAEKAAAEKAAREKAEAERLAREEADRRAREANDRKIAEAKAVAERLAREEAERKAAAEAAARKAAAEKAAAEKAAAEKAAAEKAAAEKAEAERQAALARAAEARRKATALAYARFAASDWAGGLQAARGADHADPGLQYHVAICLLEGRGTVTNVPKAVQLLSRSADLGHAPAMARLADYYLSGTNVEQHLAKAVDLLHAAARQGETSALWTLSRCLEDGRGMKADRAEASRLVREAAEKGHPRAQYAMGLRGSDPRTAADWLRRAAEQGYPPAQSRYGDCFFSGTGVARDVQEAIRWNARAAEGGDARGQRALGYCYDVGNGVQEDSKKAVELYRSAAEGGDLQGKALLSQCLFLGMGVQRDYAEAGRLARESAEGGNAFGQYMAGLCCETGNGAIRSRLGAKAWYEKAAAQGLECARERLRNLHIQ